MKEKQKGITLITLVVTIVILLILAGITILTLAGDNGLFNHAKRAKNNTLEAQELENTILGDYENRIDEITTNVSSKEDVNNVVKNSKYLILKGNTYIDTGIKEEELLNGYTILTCVYINQSMQSKINYMGILGNHTGNSGISWQFDSTTSILSLANSSSSGNSVLSIDYGPYYDKWTKITMTYGNGIAKIYFDGELLWSKENAIFDPCGNLLVGTAFNAERGMKGGMKSVKIWTKELTAEEINKINYEEKNTSVQKEGILVEMNFTNIEEMVGILNGNNYELVAMD